MLTDFVLPKDNEKKLLAMAKKLGFSKLVFLYSYDKKINSSVIESKIKSLSKNESLHLDWGIIVSETKQIQKAKQIKTPVIFRSSPESDIRAVALKHKPQGITNLEFQKHDFVHHRSSGMNHIIAQGMHENTVSYIPALSLLFSTKYKAEVLGRILQNIRLAKKYHITMDVYSFAKKPIEMFYYKDITSLLKTLGVNQKEIKRIFQRIKLK